MADDVREAPAKAGVSYAIMAKWAAAAALSGSMFALVLMGKVPVDTYLAMVVTPGLAVLGYHTAANS